MQPSRLSLHERLGRLSTWFRGQNARPLVGFYIGTYYPLHRYPAGSRCIPDGTVSVADIAVDGFLDDSDRLFELYESAGGELIWSAAPFFGLPWVEAALGCGVVADLENGCTRSTPPAGFAGNPAIPAFTESNEWVVKMLEFVSALAVRSRGRYPVGVTLMRGISDLLSALYGGEQLVFRMYEAPEEVRSVIERLTDFWIAFGRCLLDHVPPFHGGTGAFFYGVWCPGKTIWLQEDAAALLSPRLYDEFILPADRRIAASFEHSVVHLHPSRFIPSRQLADTEVDVIELHIDKGGPPAESLEKHYRTILEKKRLLVWGDITDDDLVFLMTRLPAPGLAIEIVVPTADEAGRVWDKAMSLIESRA
jgi:hypothetical protein